MTCIQILINRVILYSPILSIKSLRSFSINQVTPFFLGTEETFIEIQGKKAKSFIHWLQFLLPWIFLGVLNNTSASQCAGKYFAERFEQMSIYLNEGTMTDQRNDSIQIKHSKFIVIGITNKCPIPLILSKFLDQK